MEFMACWGTLRFARDSFTRRWVGSSSYCRGFRVVRPYSRMFDYLFTDFLCILWFHRTFGYYIYGVWEFWYFEPLLSRVIGFIL
jgi:hypothetical protein